MWRGVLNTTLCDILRVHQFPPTNTDRHEITEILMKVELSTNMHNPKSNNSV